MGTYNLTSAGLEDIFVSKLNTSGDFLWAKSMGGNAGTGGSGGWLAGAPAPGGQATDGGPVTLEPSTLPIWCDDL